MIRLTLTALILAALTACVAVPVPMVSTKGGAPVRALEAGQPADARFHAALTRTRAQRGLPPLAPNPGLDTVAARYAARLVARGVLEHRGADGSRASDRVRRAGVSQCLAGENLAQGYKTAEGAFSGWMQSKGHRENMLSARYANYGLGRSGKTWVMVMLLPC